MRPLRQMSATTRRPPGSHASTAYVRLVMNARGLSRVTMPLPREASPRQAHRTREAVPQPSVGVLLALSSRLPRSSGLTIVPMSEHWPSLLEIV